MSIFCIIVTFNGERWIKTCLNSLLISTIKVHIIVIDNRSEDRTVDIIRLNFPTVELIQNEQNIGFGQANNIGLRKALNENAKYVFLLNQDASITSETVQKLVNISKENPDYGIISPIHLNGHGTGLDKYFSNYLLKNRDLMFDALTSEYQFKVYPLQYVNAAGWLMTRQILFETGGFDPMFRHYGEDDNYCQRATFYGFKIGVVPGCYLYHDRQDREEKTILLFTSNYIATFLQNYKIKYGNINISIPELNYSPEIKKIFKQILKNVLRLSFSKVLWYKKLLKILFYTNRVLEQSRKNVLIKGPTYLFETK